MSEVLTAIKLIKFYAWESYYVDKISKARESEMNELRQSLLLKIASFGIVFIAPVLTTFACIAAYLFSQREKIPASTAFALLSLFNTLRYPFLVLPISVKSIRGKRSSIIYVAYWQLIYL
jgi:uncharacterized membrane protein (GlpM family)